MIDPLQRIAAALERLSPPASASADPLAHPAYLWRVGGLRAAQAFAPLPLALLIGIDRQKAALLENLTRLARGAAAQDTLLWGARGTGKSALVKAAVAAIQASGDDLALVDVVDTATLSDLFTVLAGVQRPFVLFIDDLGFDAPAEARTLRSMLEGGAESRPDNVRLVVTANRRHLVPRDIAEQGVGTSSDWPGASHRGGAGSQGEPRAINPRDAVDDQLALADRFGLSLGFHVLDQAGYLDIVAAYAAHHGLAFNRDDALGWARQRGSRSGRVAWQYVVDVAGRAGRSLATV